MQWRLNELLSAATAITGSMATISYAFSTAYIYALEPRFLAAFGIADLVFLFASSLNLFITTALVLSPIVAGILWMRFGRDNHQRSSLIWLGDDGPTNLELSEAKSNAATYRVGYVILGLCCIINISLLGVISFNLPAELQIGPLDNVGNLVGVAALGAVCARPRQLLPFCLPFALIVSSVTAYTAGDMMGRWDVSNAPGSGRLPCVFADQGRACLDLLVLGSDAMILRRDKRVLLIPRDKANVIASRRDHYQVEEK